MIGVTGSWLNAPGQRFGDIENHGRLIDENDDIGQLLGGKVLQQEVDCFWQCAVLGKH